MSQFRGRSWGELQFIRRTIAVYMTNCENAGIIRILFYNQAPAVFVFRSTVLDVLQSMVELG